MTPSWRPRLHFSAGQNWINDPNGPIWHAGEYHLFFQHNPLGRAWGHMSWGHAVSTDLLHWRELPVAIAEDDEWMAFSGSVVFDREGSSGLGAGPGAPLVACFTGHARRGGLQNQHLAYSLDGGRCWQRYGHNPVLDLGLTDFRDPKVLWHAASHRWVMLVSMAAAGHLAFFTSTDLRQWQHASDFHLPLEACRIWECPDLLHLAVDGNPAERAWVLKWDVFEGHPAGGSGALAVVGGFDGRSFTPHQPAQWVDGGRDFYAALAFASMPPGDERCIWLGWMNDHRYAEATPTQAWCGAMTLPRELALVTLPGGELRLSQSPLRELAALRGEAVVPAPRKLDEALQELWPPGALPAAHEIELWFDAGEATLVEVQVCVGTGPLGDEATCILIDRRAARLSVDRRHSGADPKRGAFAGCHGMAWPGARRARCGLRIVVDACSVEVFGDDGQAVVTELVFPQARSTGVRVRCVGVARLADARIWPLEDPRR